MSDQQHIVSAYDRDLEGVMVAIMKMGGLVEDSILNSAQALETRDLELAAEVRAADKRIDELEEKINDEAARLIALRAPMGRDLRTVLSVIKISGALERIGDYTKNMAKRTAVLAEVQAVNGAPASVRRMAREVEAMLREALDAYVRQDAALAQAVILRDEDVDQMYNSLFRNFLTYMMEDPRNITSCMHLQFIAKNVERMGDHVTSICEQVIYQVTGEMPDDERPKVAGDPYDPASVTED